MTIAEIEKLLIYAALKKNAGSKPKTAKELGVSLKTLYNKLHTYEKERCDPTHQLNVCPKINESICSLLAAEPMTDPNTTNSSGTT